GSFNTIYKSSYEFFIKLLAIIFRITANERIIAQYTNVLLGFTVVYLIYLILNKLKLDYKNKKIGIIIAAFFPHSLFFSGILLREMASTFFVVSAIYFLVKWYVDLSQKDFYLSIIMIFISSLFHSGVIGLLLAHLFVYVFYDNKSKKIKFSYKKNISFI